jgi:hypothetical protein
MTRRGILAASLLTLLTALAVASLSWSCARALDDSSDLLRRIEEVRLFLARQDPYQDPDLTYPPCAVPIFACLLGPVDREWLPAVWLGLNLLALAAFVLGLSRLWSVRWGWSGLLVLVLWVAACRPVRAGVALGQFHLVPMALAAWSVIAVRGRRELTGGLLLGLGLAKPTMVLPLLAAWVARGYWRAGGVALAVPIVLHLGSAVWLGVEPIALGREWLANARTQLGAGSLDLAGLVAQVWPESVPSTALVSLLLLWGGAVWSSRRKVGEDLVFAFAMGLAGVFAYHRHYDLVLFVPMVLALVLDPYSVPSRWHRTARPLGAVLGLFMIVPTHPEWIQPAAPWIDAAFAVVAYAAFGMIAARPERATSALNATDAGASKSRKKNARPGMNGVAGSSGEECDEGTSVSRARARQSPSPAIAKPASAAGAG